MAKRKLTVLLSLLFVLCFVGQAMAAYTLDWCGLNHRRYEDGQDFNRIGFQIKNANGQYVTKDQFKSITVTDPNGNVVTYTKADLDLKFSTYTMLDGGYDGNNGVFMYGTPYRTSEYYGVLPGTLIPGTYHLSIKYATEVLEKDCPFYGSVRLPIISANSIKSSVDKSGNLTATWAVPMNLCKTQPTLQTNIKVRIDVYQDTTFISELNVRIPTHMGRLFVPKALVNWLKSNGNKYFIGLYLRTNDNCNRTNSNTKSISLSSSAQDLSMDSQDSQEYIEVGEGQ
jgi:hypothetical protein